jgi:magnesium transporter
MLHRCQIIDGRLMETHEETAPIVIYVDPTEEERDYLVNQVKLDAHTLQSALDPDELARLEFEPEHVAMISKRPKHYSGEDDFLFKVASTGTFLFRDRLIIVVSEEVPLFDHIRMPGVTSPRGVILRMLYRSIYHFREHLKAISMVTDDLQTKINQAMENRYLINLFTLQKSLVFYLNSLNSNGVLIDRLKHNAVKIGFTPIEAETLDDISVENAQCYKQAEIYSNILVSLMDARASIVSNNLNVLMKTLNIITIGIMVPTLVVSAFSMNVRIPLSEHPSAFYIIMLLALTSVLVFMLFWRYRR